MRSSKLKICQLCAVDFTLYHFLIPLIDGLKKEGWEVEAICSYGKHINPLRDRGYIIKNIDIPRNLNPFKILKSFFLLYKIFKKENYDIVHVHTPVASIIGRIASKLAGVQIVIYTAHGFYFHENMNKLKFLFYLNLEKLMGYLTNVIFTQSYEDQNLATKYNILPKDKIFTIGNGVNIEKFKPFNIKKSNLIKKKLKISKNYFVVGCIARLVKEKGIVEFLEAAKSIFSKYKDVIFLVVGERLESDHDTNINDHIKSAKIKLQNNIKFLGLRDDIPELISVMDLYCLPSWREGMPRSIIEAMMMSKPILATNIRGSREEVVDKQTGLLIPIKSAKDLEYNMIKFIKNRKLCREYGVKGRKRALKLYDEAKVINLQIKLIKEQLKDSSINAI